MTTAQEIERAREVAGDRMRRLREQGYVSYYERFHDAVYLPMMRRLIEDARAKGLLPKDTL